MGTLRSGVLLTPPLEASLDLTHSPMERRAAVVVEGAALPRRPARVSQQMRANDLPIAKVVRLLRQVEGHQVEDQFEPRPVPEHEAPITEPSDRPHSIGGLETVFQEVG